MENRSGLSGSTAHVTLHCFLVFMLEIGVGKIFKSILQPFFVQISAPSSIMAALACIGINIKEKTARRRILRIFRPHL